jgi:type IV pilus assembly protein PilV
MRLIRSRARGVGLFDGLIALAILSFGVLGMTRLQVNLVRQATETQSRTVAVQLADELLSTALVDIDNAACYTLPQAGACGSAAAQERAEAWETRALATLPGAASATATLLNDQLTVRLGWTGKAAEEARTLEVTTDVRP